VIAAILRAQLLSMRMGGRGRWLSLFTGIAWYGIWVIAACAVYMGVSGAEAQQLRTLLPLGALGICAYWQFMPILSASMGSSLDMRKLMVYPMPHRRLFLVEVLLRVTTGAEMIMVLTGAIAGLFRNPLVHNSWLGIPAMMLYIAFNVLLASGTRSLLERLLAGIKPPIYLTPVTTDRNVAQEWLKRFEGAGLDGVIAKELDAAYQQWVLAQQYPVQMQQLVNQAVGLIPKTGTTDTTGSQTTYGGGFNLSGSIPGLGFPLSF